LARRVLLLHFTPRPRAARLTTQQHLAALTRLPRPAQVLSYNAVHGAPAWLRHLDFDAVVLHTTLLCMRWNPWFPRWRKRLDWLADVDCLKIALPQDEYDHAGVLDEWLDQLGVSVVCTVLDDAHRADLYPRLAGEAAFYEILTGYIDDESAERSRARIVPAADRPHDIVYRARHLPYWYGSHAQLKHRIGDAVLEHATAHGLACDVSTRAQETIFGDQWLDFLGTARATVGVESGSSVLDRRGEVHERVDELLQADPALSFEEVSARMPPGWDDYRFYAISPRHLESVVTKTAQILVEGHYSGVLEAERHYLPVRRDFSNLDEVLEAARDRPALARMAEQAYEDIYLSGKFSFSKLTNVLESVLDEHGRPARSNARPGFAIAGKLSGMQSDAERLVAEPLSSVARVGRSAYRELLAGLRLTATDADLRRLLLDYLRSTETREHVSPRRALADLLCVGTVRRAQAGKASGRVSFTVTAEVDEGERRLLLRSHRQGADALRPAESSPEGLEMVLREAAWQFFWDHSSVGTDVTYPLMRSRTLRLTLPAGPHPLPLLDWLARQEPHHVAAALAPVLDDRR
jgi:hypothetical protein